MNFYMTVIFSVHIEQCHYFHQALLLTLVVTVRYLFIILGTAFAQCDTGEAPGSLPGVQKQWRSGSALSNIQSQQPSHRYPRIYAPGEESLRLTLLSFHFRLILHGSSAEFSVIGQGPTNEDRLYQPGGYRVMRLLMAGHFDGKEDGLGPKFVSEFKNCIVLWRVIMFKCALIPQVSVTL